MSKFDNDALFNKVFAYCLTLGNPLFTGSRAMGLERKKSDWDVVMVLPTTGNVARLIINEFSGKFLLGGVYWQNMFIALNEDRYIIEIQDKRKPWYNFWTFRSKVHVILESSDYGDITNWYSATEYCKNHKEEARNKKNRIKIFERFGAKQK